jgi:hypothetical protein
VWPVSIKPARRAPSRRSEAGAPHNPLRVGLSRIWPSALRTMALANDQ